MKALMLLKKHSKQRRNIALFAPFLASPATGALKLPASARLALRSIGGAIAGSIAATITGATSRTIKTPSLPAGGILVLDYVERAFTITPSAGFEILLDKGLNNFAVIGSA